MKTVKTPCVGICSTVFGDVVCRGCKRFVHEVIDWNTYTNSQKLLVKNRLELLAEQVLLSKLSITDRAQFFSSLAVVEIELASKDTEQKNAEQKDTSLILEFLRKAAKQLDNLSDHGLHVLPEYIHYSPNELKEIIDNEIHILSSATYHKNFKSRIALHPSGSQSTSQSIESQSTNPQLSSAQATLNEHANKSKKLTSSEK